MKRIISAWMAVGSLALFGCSAAAEPEPVEVAQDSKVELLYNSGYTRFFGQFGNADKELVSRFEAAHPNVEVTIGAPPDGRTYFDVYDDLNASTPPDVKSSLADGGMRASVEHDLILDISDLWLQEGWNEAYPDWARALSTVDGKQYFVPTSYDVFAVFYHKPTFEQHELEPPQTWDEFIAVAGTLQQRGITPIAGSEFAWFEHLNMRLNGPQFHQDLLLGLERYDDPRVRQVFEFWQDLADDGYFSRQTQSLVGNIQLMLDGEVAMLLAARTFLVQVPAALLDEFDFFRFPIIDPNVPVGEAVSMSGYFVPARSLEPEAAREFVAFMGSVEAQAYLAETVGWLPTHSGMDPGILTPELRQRLAITEAADTVSLNWFDGVPIAMAARAGRVFSELGGSSDIDSLLAGLEQARQEVYAEQ